MRAELSRVEISGPEAAGRAPPSWPRDDLRKAGKITGDLVFTVVDERDRDQRRRPSCAESPSRAEPAGATPDRAGPRPWPRRRGHGRGDGCATRGPALAVGAALPRWSPCVTHAVPASRRVAAVALSTRVRGSSRVRSLVAAVVARVAVVVDSRPSSTAVAAVVARRAVGRLQPWSLGSCDRPVGRTRRRWLQPSSTPSVGPASRRRLQPSRTRPAARRSRATASAAPSRGCRPSRRRHGVHRRRRLGRLRGVA